MLAAHAQWVFLECEAEIIEYSHTVTIEAEWDIEIYAGN